MRQMVREHVVTAANLVYPLFIEEDNQDGTTSKSKTNLFSTKNNKNSNAHKVAIPSMPGIYRHNLDSMMNEIDESVR